MIIYNSVIDDRIELPYSYYLCECAEKQLMNLEFQEM